MKPMKAPRDQPGTKLHNLEVTSMGTNIDLDYTAIEDVDDAEEELIHALIWNRATSAFEWHWVSRELAGYWFAEEDAE
jgi:hypothetical protein